MSGEQKLYKPLYIAKGEHIERREEGGRKGEVPVRPDPEGGGDFALL